MRSSVCRERGEVLDCTSPTFTFLDKWNELDANGDGVWSYEEARQDVANLGCRLADTGLTTEAVFRSMCRGIDSFFGKESLLQNISIKPPKEIAARTELPYAYFEYWQGALVLCTATDLKRCGQMLRQGVFDGAISSGKLENLDAAMEYCNEFLKPDGVCDKFLPITYIMYRQQVADKCGVAHFTHGMNYVNPHDNHDVTQVVNVVYENMGQFHMAESRKFRFFLGLILLVWYINLLGELQAILRLADFAYHIKTEDDDPFKTRNVVNSLRSAGRMSFMTVSRTMQNAFSAGARRATISFSSQGGGGGEDDGGGEASARSERIERAPQRSMSEPALGSPLGGTPRSPRSAPRRGNNYVRRAFGPALGTPRLGTPRGEDGTIVISGISSPHKVTCCLMICIRSMLVVYMAIVGTIFILTTYSYADLLMNAVALAFVFELPEFFYMLLVGPNEKDELDQVAPMRHRTLLPDHTGVKGFLASNYFWGLFFFPALCFAIIQWNQASNTSPIYEALDCLCFQRGDRCLASPYFSTTWWDQHWTNSSWVSAAP